MAPNKYRAEYSTLFGFHERNVTICSYVPKQKKAVILHSTMHLDSAVHDDEKKKPHMITDYNKYKTGVGAMDQMVGRYITHRRTQRWPLAVRVNILDVAALAACIIYYGNNNMLKKHTNQRRVFLRQLSEELCKPLIEDRSLNNQVMRHHSTKNAIEDILGVHLGADPDVERNVEPRDSTGRVKVTGSCHLCYRSVIKRRRKTRKRCEQCGKPVCDEHSPNKNILL
ncbi:uncharacterized protein LOC117181165 [Belonocnema kinseyi]|uniref:uncharacterized protein LOC117181165 n=1 Tax=Belonocnema kinseyi TaxID=2817044 RepID=UPI00143D199E|nr:uncharacterized protein LOC117181165 [Belonocnema kinseyi]